MANATPSGWVRIDVAAKPRRDHGRLCQRSGRPAAPRRDDRRRAPANGAGPTRPGGDRLRRGGSAPELPRPRRARRRPGARAARSRNRDGRPGRAVCAELPGVGAHPACNRPRRRDPRGPQPRLPRGRAPVRARALRQPAAVRPRRQPALPGDARGARRPAGRARAPRLPRRARSGGRARRVAERARRPCGGVRLRSAREHAVHERDDGRPDGADADPPQPPQQRLLRRAADGLHRRRPDLRPGSALPRLRDDVRHAGRAQPRRDDGPAGSEVRPGRGARRGGGRALHEHLRRSHDRSSRCSSIRSAARSISARCGPASLPARPARRS